jgi:hypothetical protein
VGARGRGLRAGAARRLILAEVDWVTIAGVATAVGTLILAVATFGATRSANRAARIAEESLLAGLRPALVPSRETDPPEEILWGDDHAITLPGGAAWAEEFEGNVYLALALRNVGAGLAVLRGYRLVPARPDASSPHGEPGDFRRQQLDLYVPIGDASYWQASLRDPNDPLRAELRTAVHRDAILTLELLYTDHRGGQPTITRFALRPGDGPRRQPRVMRHWSSVAFDLA